MRWDPISYNSDWTGWTERSRSVSWQLQEAKQKFSEVVNRSLAEGPQFVTRRGEEVAVIVSLEDYDRLLGENGNEVKDFLLSGPELPDLDIRRDEAPARVVDFGS
ncbi:MAG: type II toxin-antitoxin system Phd/YefM family antitoxin [Rubrobacter sp.]|nr:type II toxin-antitoxin system Phd/YefM family antitoxin [Rubrobacter sp.]